MRATPRVILILKQAFSLGQTTQNSGPEECRDMVTGVQGQIRYRPEKVTGGAEEILKGHDMVTAVQEEIPYCSSGLSSEK